jgi:hypothetical protein
MIRQTAIAFGVFLVVLGLGAGDIPISVPSGDVSGESGDTAARIVEVAFAGSPGTDPGCDTLFGQWFTNAKYDSGYDWVRVDGLGDTLALYLRWLVCLNPHIRMAGPMGGVNRGTRTRIWHLHRFEIQSPGHTFESAEDFCTQGGNGIIQNLKLTKLRETPSELRWQQTWRFIKRVAGEYDTLDVARTVIGTCDQPYFLVHYDFTWVNARPGSLRFLWYFQRQTKFGRRRSKHEVGYAPGYGLVTTRRAFKARDLGYCAGMIRMGNPLATWIDTLADGRSSFRSPELMEDFGSGLPAFPASFICFNASAEIVPSEFAWIDTVGAYVTTLHCDSSVIRVDTTNVLDYEERYYYGRTELIEFEHGQTKSLEYAVGRALVGGEDEPLEIPVISWWDRGVDPQDGETSGSEMYDR